MATDDALSGDRVNIWFAPKSTDGDDLADNAAEFQSFIGNFDESGGEKETEQVPVFSDTGSHGNVTRRKPRNQKELSFDIVMRFNDKVLDFKKIENGAEIAADGVGADFVVGMVAVQSFDASGNFFWTAYNNVDAVNFDTEFSAEEEWKGTLNFKLSTADPDGITNMKESTVLDKSIIDATDGLKWV